MIRNWINGALQVTDSKDSFQKFDPHTGSVLGSVQNSSRADVDAAVSCAQEAFRDWADRVASERASILRVVTTLMSENLNEFSKIIAKETGKPPHDAKSELAGAIALGEFFAGEGARLYGTSLRSTVRGKRTYTVREPYGVAALIVPANTPIANLAWKVFPALVCGNTVVVKASEDAPHTANFFVSLFAKAGLPAGVLNVIHGVGARCGPYLIDNPTVKVISFTGSSGVGKTVSVAAAKRLTPLSLELGGKNPFIVCHDADLKNAVHWAVLSCFSNAGQRCAAASRLIVSAQIADEFIELFKKKVELLKLGTSSESDLGPLLTRSQQERVTTALLEAKNRGARFLCGGTDYPDGAPPGGVLYATHIDLQS